MLRACPLTSAGVYAELEIDPADISEVPALADAIVARLAGMPANLVRVGADRLVLTAAPDLLPTFRAVFCIDPADDLSVVATRVPPTL